MEEESVLWRRTGTAEDGAYDRAYAQIQEQIEVRTTDSSENASGQQPPMSWKKGDRCTAIYSGDARPYEAEIKCIRGRQCIVRFIGYGNEERAFLSDLQPSNGEEARQAQQAEALADETPLDGYAGWMDLPTETSSSHDGPPMPLPQSVFSEDSQENDALSSMLMAWYLSGYHTGYYQALQESQQAVTHE